MTLTRTTLKPALDAVLYGSDASSLAEAFVAKLDQLEEQNLGIAFARHCMMQINAFPRPLRDGIVLALLDSSLPVERVVKIVRPMLDGPMWRPAMRVMTGAKVPRDEWFQAIAEHVPPEMAERLRPERERRLGLFEGAER